MLVFAADSRDERDQTMVGIPMGMERVTLGAGIVPAAGGVVFLRLRFVLA